MDLIKKIEKKLQSKRKYINSLYSQVNKLESNIRYKEHSAEMLENELDIIRRGYALDNFDWKFNELEWSLKINVRGEVYLCSRGSHSGWTSRVNKRSSIDFWGVIKLNRYGDNHYEVTDNVTLIGGKYGNMCKLIFKNPDTVIDDIKSLGITYYIPTCYKQYVGDKLDPRKLETFKRIYKL